MKKAAARSLIVMALFLLFGSAGFAQDNKDFLKLVRTATPEQIAATIAGGADVNQYDRDGATPLMFAAACNPNPDVVTALLKAGARIGTRNKDGVNALMYAADFNVNPEVVTALLAAGAKITDKDLDGETALIWAARENPSPQVIAALLQAGAKIDERDSFGMTPLIKAVRYNPSRPVIDALLSAGANINDRDKAKRSPLMYACENPTLAALVPAFLQAGAAIDDRDKDGRTALMWAAMKATDPSLVMLLLKAGSNGALTTRDGSTAYDYAAANEALKSTEACATLQNAQAFFQLVRSAAPDTVRAALVRGAKAQDRDEEGWTPLMYAAERNPSVDVITLLLKKGARIDDKDFAGRTALMIAALKCKSADIVMALLSSGARGDMKSQAGKTPFDYALSNASLKGTPAVVALQRAQNLCELVRSASPDLVTEALGAGAKAEDRDEDQWTPLMYAAARNPSPRVITALVAAGAAVDSVCPGGFTPLILAARSNANPDVVTALLAAGASGEVVSSDGKTAFDWAASNAKLKGTPALKAIERSQNIFQLVRTCTAADVQNAVTAGADLGGRNDAGLTPLMIAARGNPNPDAITALLKAGASGQVTTSDGKTAFDWAAGNAKLKGTPALKTLERSQNIFQLVRTCTAADVQTAVTAGANVNGEDANGLTPLMIAAQRNADAKVIAALVKAGATLNDLSADGHLTALMIAARDTKSPDVVVALLKAGANGLLTSDDGKTAYDYGADNPKLKGTAALKALDGARTPPSATQTPTNTGTPATTAPSGN